MDEINKWISNKAMYLPILNDKIDFQIDGNQFRTNELWFPGFSLKAGIYTDHGYRFRENEFQISDSWIPGKEEVVKFFDSKVFNTDTYFVSDDIMAIADLWFRLDTDKIIHTRNVFGISDLLGTIGGVELVLLQIAGMIFKDYFKFNFII